MRAHQSLRPPRNVDIKDASHNSGLHQRIVRIIDRRNNCARQPIQSGQRVRPGHVNRDASRMTDLRRRRIGCNPGPPREQKRLLQVPLADKRRKLQADDTIPPAINMDCGITRPPSCGRRDNDRTGAVAFREC